MSQYINILGIIFITKEILELITSYIIGSYYEHIAVKTFIDGKAFSSGVQLSMNPRLEFEFTLFLVGLSLLVLASLLKSGNQIQQENDLTI